MTHTLVPGKVRSFVIRLRIYNTPFRFQCQEFSAFFFIFLCLFFSLFFSLFFFDLRRLIELESGGGSGR